MNDDLTSIRRVGDDATSYVPEPTPDLPYFDAANARDPRLGIIHEGAHSQQLALSWAQPNPLRRHFIDSVANEGIAHYNEELMLTAGLFADAPHSQTIVHNFMRLRALRVVVDVNLATGVFSLPEAVDFFVRMVPMDVGTATEETSYYVATPGLAMSYLVGKHEVMRLVADAAVAAALDGAEFSLRDVHDAVWRNGNVPMSLLRWELLGDRGDVDVLDAAGPWWEAPPAGADVTSAVGLVSPRRCRSPSAPSGASGSRRAAASGSSSGSNVVGSPAPTPTLPGSLGIVPSCPSPSSLAVPSSSAPSSRVPGASVIIVSSTLACRLTITHGGSIRRGVDTGGRSAPAGRAAGRGDSARHPCHRSRGCPV